MTTLLPPNATALERALDGAIGAQFPLPTDRVRAVWDWQTCPAELLGFLAYQLSVDLWDDAWPEPKKRGVCRDALKLHRLKTTLAGIRAHVALADAELVQVIRPPAKLYPTRGMTAAERETWLQTLPQIRLYPFEHRALGSKRVFLSRGPHRRFFANAYPRPSRGIELYGTRATFWDRGVETEISYTKPDGETLRLAIPRTTPRPFLGHAYLRGTFLTRSEASLGVVTLRLSGDIGGFAVAKSLAPVSIEPTRIAQERTAPHARAFFGNSQGRRWTMASAGPRQVYDRVCLTAPDRVASRRHGRVFLGHARLGYEPYQAELRISVPLKRSPLRAARFAGHGFLKGADVSGVERAARAVSVSKAARDTILITTTTHRQVSFGDGLRFGDFTFGEIRKVA